MATRLAKPRQLTFRENAHSHPRHGYFPKKPSVGDNERANAVLQQASHIMAHALKKTGRKENGTLKEERKKICLHFANDTLRDNRVLSRSEKKTEKSETAAFEVGHVASRRVAAAVVQQ